MGADREVFWALLALVGAFVALFGVMLWLRLVRRAGEERRARKAEAPDEGP
ncbi:MAG: hypothetical protein ACOY5Y_10935 [Pseudomonadota bacterium]|jgi:hypothetical protein